ncbi:MAG: hypothetical protein Phog2KO_41380 [Phototrophicaceae bacterium]
MPNINTMLREHDEGILPTLASVWGVTVTNMTAEQQIRALNDALQVPENAEKVWAKLGDDERQALQTLIGSQLQMSGNMFKRFYGDIRKMGKGQVEREAPHKNPQSIAEGLFYKGMIGEQFKQGKKGLEPTIFVPEELAEILPLHKTAYEGIENEIPPQAKSTVIDTLMPVEEEYIEDIQPANTSIVDDMCTLLAFLRNYSAGVLEDDFLPADIERLMPYLLDKSPERLTFMLGIGASADLITTQEGRAYPKRSSLQKWLNSTRSEQLKTLLDAWHSSTIYRDMWHVRGLHVDYDAGFPYDPLLGRDAMIEFLKRVAPASEWFAVDELIDAIKAIDSDFQRPNGDYESWYIRNDAGEYLHGYESWDAIEGALIDFYIKGPMHWLGLTDISEDVARFTAYGRAYIGLSDFPYPPDSNELITIGDDGVLVVSRRVSRVDRFQVARFSTWGTPDDSEYYYRLDAEGIEMAGKQSITTGHILTFLKKHADGKALPERVNQLLENWQGGGGNLSEVSFERLLVLRTTSPEVLDRIYNEPTLRRYLGAKLGEMACIIRENQQEDLQVALGDVGIKVEIM